MSRAVISDGHNVDLAAEHIQSYWRARLPFCIGSRRDRNRMLSGYERGRVGVTIGHVGYLAIDRQLDDHISPQVRRTADDQSGVSLG